MNEQNEIDIDTLRERIAIEVEHLPPEKAQAEYDRRILIEREVKKNENRKQHTT